MLNRLPLHAALFVCFAALATGCQSGQQVSSQRLIEHQALIDFSGLKEPELAEPIRLQVSLPQTWKLHDTERKALYTHQQWKSPTEKTGVGAIYARLPIPMSANMILHFAIKHYADQANDGRELGRWEDEAGRKWFEAETSKYHARGYVMVSGRDAWIVYSGFKTDVPPEPGEISLAARCIQTFVPTIGDVKLPAQAGHSETQPATQSATQPAETVKAE